MRLSLRLHRYLHHDEEEEGQEAFDDLAIWQIMPEILKWLSQQDSVPLATLPFASNRSYAQLREKVSI